MSDFDGIVESPCIRNCCLSENDICLGCFRSLEEITRWNEADNQERINILKNAGQRQKDKQGGPA